MEREFNEAEADLHRKFSAHVRKAAADAGLAVAPNGALQPAALDQLWTTWGWAAGMSDDDKKVAVAFFGFGFGDYLAEQTGMQWRIVADDQGSDYALILPGTDVTAFPLATVAKRLGQAAFFSTIAPSMISDIRNAAARAGKPWWKFW